MVKAKVKAEPKVEAAGVTQDEQENTVAEASAAPRIRAKGNWQKMSREDILRHSHAGNLIGHDHRTGEVILKDPTLTPPELSKEHLYTPGQAFKITEA